MCIKTQNGLSTSYGGHVCACKHGRVFVCLWTAVNEQVEKKKKKEE